MSKYPKIEITQIDSITLPDGAILIKHQAYMHGSARYPTPYNIYTKPEEALKQGDYTIDFELEVRKDKLIPKPIYKLIIK